MPPRPPTHSQLTAHTRRLSPHLPAAQYLLCLTPPVGFLAVPKQVSLGAVLRLLLSWFSWSCGISKRGDVK